MTISPEALEAIAADHEAHERTIKSLQRQRDHFINENAVLQEKLNGLQLRLSVANDERQLAQLGEAQLLRRVVRLEQVTTSLADAANRFANYVQGLPQREELERLKESVSGLLARESV